MNRKLLASASIVGVLSAPVAIAVADENDTHTKKNVTTASAQKQYRALVQQRIKAERAAKRAEIREKKAERKAKARKRAKKRAQLAKQRVAVQAQAQVAAAPAQSAPQQGAGTATPGNLSGIAACESGGNPGAVSPDGQYRGKYQFDQQTWASVGGSGDPAAASEAEQDQRAAMLYARAGSSPWPNCG